KAVMARIDVQEARLERMRVVVGEAEAEDVAVERHHPIDLVDALDVEHDVAEPERPGAEPRDWPARHERIGRDIGAVKDLQPIAKRTAADDQFLPQPLTGERARAARNRNARRFEPRRERTERSGVRDLPAEHVNALAAVGIHDDPLLAVVHAERDRRARLVDALQPEEAGTEARPLRDVPGAALDITQRFDVHARPVRRAMDWL